MRKLLIIYLQLICFVAFAQPKIDVTIQWSENTKTFFGENNFNIPQFTNKEYFYDFNQQKLFFTIKTNSQSPLNDSDILISNLVFENISNNQLGDLPIENIATQLSPKITNTISRSVSQSFLTINPIIKDQNIIKRLKSFSYTIDKKVILQNKTPIGFKM